MRFIIRLLYARKVNAVPSTCPLSWVRQNEPWHTNSLSIWEENHSWPLLQARISTASLTPSLPSPYSRASFRHRWRSGIGCRGYWTHLIELKRPQCRPRLEKPRISSDEYSLVWNKRRCRCQDHHLNPMGLQPGTIHCAWKFLTCFLFLFLIILFPFFPLIFLPYSPHFSTKITYSYSISPQSYLLIPSSSRAFLYCAFLITSFHQRVRRFCV